jgi:mRNA interferase MazF
MRKGSVVLIPFPFTDLKGNKIRPAVILAKSELDITICFVTSVLKWKVQYDVPVSPSINNGLKVPSLIRTGKIATVDTDLVLGKLGDLSYSEIKELDKGLKGLLQLQ